MNNFSDLFQNKVLLSAVLGWCTAQIIKFILIYIRERRIDIKALVAPGGMPSGHSTTMVALTTSVGMHAGWGTPLFAVTFAMALVVMYDATGIRRSAGKQAEAINRVLERLSKGDPASRKQIYPEELREILGHTPVQVLAGAALGVAIALIIG